ncbi:HDOD domain-containing protein [Undibacterium sp.]|jgi:HD-like signal output (HDOD) protein|uniref:HDOD domain-containing protein n=1 Tax=Undibacterium sp. TaxID=1914977 RepID=UPI002B8EEB41|nr:HDOD domain-containing protein [Undibacterium sp.]HTD06191.1 HDOD domain-containing protein [Undibacterium sp.]
MNRVEAFKSIAEQARRGELIFPTNVAASLKIQRAIDDPDCSLETASRLILTEPLLAARVVSVANSVAYNRFGGAVANVRTAIPLLGFRTLHSIVAAIVVRQIAGTIIDPALSAKAQKLWEHTAHVAALAHVIARRVGNVDPDTAMFAGVVHEVSGFYLLSRADHFPDLLDGELEEAAVAFEAPIGRAVLAKLMIPKAVAAAVESLWCGLRVMPPETLGDTLILANDLAEVASPLDLRPAETIRQDASEIDCAIGDGTLASILEESAEEVRSLTAALLG